MSKPFFIFYMLYRSGLCLKEFGTLKNHTKSAKIMSKMKKLISHFSWEISHMEISRFLVSHEELRRVDSTMNYTSFLDLTCTTYYSTYSTKSNYTCNIPTVETKCVNSSQICNGDWGYPYLCNEKLQCDGKKDLNQFCSNIL